MIAKVKRKFTVLHTEDMFYLLMAICRMDIDQITYQKSKRDILKERIENKRF